MNQQKLEQALRDIAQVLENTGTTMSHDAHGDRTRSNAALGTIARITHTTLKEIDDGRRTKR